MVAAARRHFDGPPSHLMSNQRSEIEMQVDHILRLVVTTWRGEFDMPAIERTCKQRTEEGGHGYPQIIDAIDAHIANLSADSRMVAVATIGLAEHSLKYGRCGRTAIVVHSQIDFGMCRTIAAYFEPAGEIAVFYRRDEALKWLGVVSIEKTVG